jgi:Rrf2 family protein
MFDLVYYGRGNPMRIKDISQRQGIPRRYLEQIFNKLLKAGLLKSRRGPRGGYLPAKAPAEISIADIIVAADGPLVPVPVKCLTENSSKSKECDYFRGCVTRHLWKETQRLLLDYYHSVSLEDLVSMADEQGVPKDSEEDYMYFI